VDSGGICSLALDQEKGADHPLVRTHIAKYDGVYVITVGYRANQKPALGQEDGCPQDLIPTVVVQVRQSCTVVRTTLECIGLPKRLAPTFQEPGLPDKALQRRDRN
jgi:predicted nucleic acid-binding protein